VIGRNANLMFFWDYDTQWGADRSRLNKTAQSWGPSEFRNTEQLLELHAEYEVPACFAVVGAAALPGERPYHDQSQIRRMHGAGHEVASHSFHHDWLPGLNSQQLRATLTNSKDALEQCISDKVVTFVPPYNQPFDYLAGMSISLSERAEAGSERTDLKRLCEALCETGYQFCRVAYRPLGQRIRERLAGRRLNRAGRLETIEGVTCVRLNTGCGFQRDTQEMLGRCVQTGGLIVAYGHPHSIHSGNSQDEQWLVPFLRQVAEFRHAGKLQITLPRDTCRID
jgi:hypothetical protein